MIFVTGGTGLVGSHLLLELIRRGEKVRALKRRNSQPDQVRKAFSWYTDDYEELFGKIEWVEGDMLDIYSLEEALRGISLIYHCAAAVSFDRKKRAGIIHNNVAGTSNLVNAALTCGVKKICHVSSISALGKGRDNEPVNEENKWIPSKKNTGYSESKFFSETEIWRGVEEGLEAVVVNPSVIIGPGNWESGSTGFFPQIDRGMPFYTRGSSGFVDVRDVADAMILLTSDENFKQSRNQKYLLNAENISFYDFFCQVADALGKPRPTIFASDLILAVAWRAVAAWSFLTGKEPRLTRETISGSNRERSYDGSKISRMFGFNYRPVSQAVLHTADCYLKERGRR